MGNLKYTDDDLIKQIQEKAKELGKTPKLSEFSKSSTAQKRFGTWNNFLKEAGL